MTTTQRLGQNPRNFLTYKEMKTKLQGDMGIFLPRAPENQKWRQIKGQGLRGGGLLGNLNCYRALKRSFCGTIYRKSSETVVKICLPFRCPAWISCQRHRLKVSLSASKVH